tara:strand:- start:224 stop:370 length:147 start_codon:yes stop_codon:yes gene_type:complete
MWHHGNLGERKVSVVLRKEYQILRTYLFVFWLKKFKFFYDKKTRGNKK